MGAENSLRVVQVDKLFSIDLDAIPGAGYMWDMTQQPEKFELVSQEVVSTSKEIGGNSTQRFNLIAHQPGLYLLKFELKRKWETSSVKTFEISVEVK